MNYSDEIEAYNKDRDAAMLTGDVNNVIALKRKYGLRFASSMHVEEIAMHKAITGIQSLPFEFRKQSYDWLISRGYTTMDDGELRG